MARDVPNSGGAELSNTGGTPVTAAPFTMACWFNPDVEDINRDLMSLRNASGTERFSLSADGSAGDVVAARCTVASATAGNAVTSTGFDAGIWYHACGIWASSTSRAAYINGGSKGTDTASAAPSGVDRIRNAVLYDGKIAEAAIWNVALTDAEVALLALYTSPLRVRPESLLAYWPMIGKYSPEIDVVGTYPLTITGTVPDFAHPRIFYIPRPALVVPIASAAITGTAGDNATEAEIVTGGETIIITLTNDSWVASGATFDAQRQAIIDGLDSAQAEATGWNAEVRDKQGVAGVVRTSDTVATITLDAQAAYDITATETITVTVPASAVSRGNAITASPTFNVTAVGGAVGPLVGGKLIGGGVLAGRLVR